MLLDMVLVYLLTKRRNVPRFIVKDILVVLKIQENPYLGNMETSRFAFTPMQVVSPLSAGEPSPNDSTAKPAKNAEFFVFLKFYAIINPDTIISADN